MKVYALLSNRKRWTQGAYARNARSRKRDPNAADAVRWCLFGAIRHEYPDPSEQWTAVRRLSDAIGRELNRPPAEGYHQTRIVDFNDDNPHARVLKVVQAAGV